jgi:hypothetical protein
LFLLGIYCDGQIQATVIDNYMVNIVPGSAGIGQSGGYVGQANRIVADGV